MPGADLPDDRRSKRVLLVAFFLSGFSSLTYQVAWQRVLTQVIGVDALSIALIVSVFMWGLGLGGLLGARAVRWRRGLLGIYAAVELALAVFGFFSVGLLRGLSAWLAPQTPGFAIEFAANFALLAIPTILMGLTLPLMVHFVRNRYTPGTAVGTMYSANIVGAAVGTLVAGFLLLGTLGLTGTCRVISGVNVLVALVMLALSGRETVRDTPEPAATGSDGRLSVVLVASFVTGFVALAYEIAFFRIFTAYFGMVSYVFPLLLFAYLGAMAVGNSLFGKAADRRDPAWLAGLAAIGAVATTLVVLVGPRLMLLARINQERLELDRFPSPDLVVQVIRLLAMSVVLMIPIGFISGLFPVLVRVFTRDRQSLGRSTGVIYFVQTLGNASGVLVTALVLLPSIGTVATLRLLGALLVVVAWLVAASRGSAVALSRRGLVTAAATILMVGLYPGSFYHSVRDFYDAYRNGLRTPLAPAIVKEDAVGVTLAYPIPEGYWINIGRERTTPLVTHANAWEIWPLELVAATKPTATRALIVGIGPGEHLPVLERLYPGIQIDVVELNPTLIELMDVVAEPTIRASLKRANVYTTDGRRFVLKHPDRRYDIIQIGVNHASTSGAGNLFTREFFQTLRRQLTPDGVLTFNGYSGPTKAALQVFSSVAVAEPGEPAAAAAAAAAVGAAGSGPRVSHVIAWNRDDEASFRTRLQSAVRYPSVIPAQIDAAPIGVRPNWDSGCLVFREQAASLLSAVTAATDDLPSTEYFLTQRQNVAGVSPASDPRIWGHPAGCTPLKSMLVANGLSDDR